jgi:hypothetical protein
MEAECVDSQCEPDQCGSENACGASGLVKRTTAFTGPTVDDLSSNRVNRLR